MQGVAMSHPIIEDLLWRHATKKYDASRRVSEEDLNVIFEAMRLTASSINSQPWKFLVIESNAAKERMNRTFANRFQYNQPHVFASSHIILFAYNPYYTRDNFAEIVDDAIKDKRTKPEDREQAFGSFMFAELNTDETGNTATWTKAQTYIALGNTLHTLARLRIDSTPMEGIDIDLVNEEFKDELDGYQCDVALAIGYHHQEQDYNAKLPKSRRSLDSVMVRI
jgi:nitroreductase/dihydropteridine reductase